MDGFLNDIGGGQRPMSLVEEAWHQEQKRKMYDIIRVANPTNEDFWVAYDTNQHQRIPANSTIDIPHYIAIRYVNHMKNHLIHREAQRMHDAQLAERDKKGLPRYTDKYTENKETYETTPYPKTNDPAKIADIYGQLWVGTVYEFGRDKMPTNQDPRSGEVNLAPVEQQALEALSKRRVSPEDGPLAQFQARPSTPPPATPPPPLQPPTGFADLSHKLDPSEVTSG
jgi:hypothetical protein